MVISPLFLPFQAGSGNVRPLYLQEKVSDQQVSKFSVLDQLFCRQVDVTMLIGGLSVVPSDATPKQVPRLRDLLQANKLI